MESDMQEQNYALIAYDSEGSSVFIPGGLKNIEIMPWDFGKDQQEQEKQH